MPETIINSVLSGDIDVEVLLRWLNNEADTVSNEFFICCCSKSEFVEYFLSYLRNQTDKILQTNTNALQVLQHQCTPETKLVSQRRHRRSISEPNCNDHDDKPLEYLLSSNIKKRDRYKHKKRGKSIKTKLFMEIEPMLKSRSHEQNLNCNVLSPNRGSPPEQVASTSEASYQVAASTPVKQVLSDLSTSMSPISSESLLSTPASNNTKDQSERCDTPRESHKKRNSHRKSSASLGDYIVTAQLSKSTKKKKSTSKSNVNNSYTDSMKDLVKSYSDSQKIKSSNTKTNDSISDSLGEFKFSKKDLFTEVAKKKNSPNISELNHSFIESKQDMGLRNADIFPEIEKSVRAKNRINPTPLHSCSKSSLNSFNTDSFQQPSILASEQAFKDSLIEPMEMSNDYETERNLLKLERHKLMEKFNILKANASPKKAVTPNIRIIRKESSDQKSCISADVNKITYTNEIDMLVNVYDCLLKNNYILSINSEIYFLISILLSRQYEDDYINVKAKLDNNLLDFLLKSIHNCSYFAVRSLWLNKLALKLILDKTSLKLLGENKNVRSFYPKLAKFLLNLYGLKCEAETLTAKDSKTDNKFPSDIVCFNFETDNLENFPSMLSFENFKKQRDLFYEIVRWWALPQNRGSGYRNTLKLRVNSLLSLAVAPANHAHLARLIRDLMVVDCRVNIQESKTRKLQRKMISTEVESYKLVKFNVREQFYRDLIMFAEDESFRVHLRDAFASEVMSMDASVTISDFRNNASTSSDLSAGYLKTIGKLCVLSKFLGYLTSLPYTQVPVDYAIKTRQPIYSHAWQTNLPKELVSKSDISVRNVIQPSIDVISILLSAQMNHRLTITIPWLVHYLVMLDHATLRTIYYTNLLKHIFEIYHLELKDNSDNKKVVTEYMKPNTKIYLKLCLGWLFEMPQFPKDLLYELTFPNRKNVPVEMHSNKSIDSLNLVDEYVVFEVCDFLKEFNSLWLTSRSPVDGDVRSFKYITPVPVSMNTIQARLEEELIKSQPLSTRRLVEMVIDRVTSAIIKDLPPTLTESRMRAKSNALVAAKMKKYSCADLVSIIENIYKSELKALQTRALSIARHFAGVRTQLALSGLLATNTTKEPLLAVTKKSIVLRVSKWIGDNWATISIFCKNVETELQDMMVLGDNFVSTVQPEQEIPFDKQVLVSPASTMFGLKEFINAMLNYESTNIEDMYTLLEDARLSCDINNIFLHPSTTQGIHQLSCELVITCISHEPNYVTPTLFKKLDIVWNICCPERHSVQENRPSPEVPRDFDEDVRAPTPVSDDESNTAAPIAGTSKSTTIVPDCVIPKTPHHENKILKCYERILCPRNINILSLSKRQQVFVWEKMAEYIVFLLKNNYMMEDCLTEQCLAVYRQDWSQIILKNLSRCMYLVSSQWGRNSDGKFTLFLDFLAEYCNDMDYEQDVAIMY